MTRNEKVLWLFFAATSAQLVFLHPSVTVVPGDRTNLFSGLLCFLTLLMVMILGRKDTLRLRSPEVLISLALTVLAVLSGVLSPAPLASSLRVFALLASGLGGFWCARILLSTPENQHRFQWLCLFLLGGLIVVSLAGALHAGKIEYFLCGRSHPVVGVIFLLSFAPLALLSHQSRSLTLLGLVLLGLGYAASCLSGSISVIFIPLALCLLGALGKAVRWKHLILITVVMALAVGFFHKQIYWWKLSPQYPHYRLENFPFSWSIAKAHPWLGIGLRAPREQFLDGYQLHFPFATPFATKEHFAKNIREIVTADNIFLTFLAGLGIPFTLIYGGALVLLLAKLIGLAYHPPAGLFFHPLVLLFPLGVTLVHCQFYDGLLFVQTSWFFHILLGLIPVGRVAAWEAGIPGPLNLSNSPGEPTVSPGGPVAGMK